MLSQIYPLCSTAQDQVNFTQFFLSPYLINPSYAGIDGKPLLSFTYRKQWATIEGGPTIANFNIHAPLGKRLAGGFSATNDQRGVLNNSSLLISVSYNIQIQSNIFIRFGISAGGTWNTVDIEKLSEINDPKLPTILDNHTALTGNAGISAHIKSFHFGISMPLIFQPAYVSTDAFTITEVEPFQALIFYASQRFYFNGDKHIFEPHVIYRINEGLPSQYEVAAVLHLNHVLWMGGSYKQDYGISALGGVKLNNSLAIGGVYSIENTGINELNSPSYEFSLNYLFGQRKKDTPMYSFVNTVKEKEKKATRKSASEMIAERRRQRELLAKENARKKPDPEQNEIRNSIATTPTAASAVISEGNRNKAETTPSEGQPGDDLHRPRFYQSEDVPASQGQIYYEQELLRRLQQYADNPRELHEYGPEDYPNANKHDYVQMGNHAGELEVSNYVVAGSFREEDVAKTFADGLSRDGFGAKYGYLSSKSMWFVYVFKTNNINQVRRQKDRFRETKMLRDAWLLTVSN
jgi:type IX secretion system PorP/SprF family membrane protein